MKMAKTSTAVLSILTVLLAAFVLPTVASADDPDDAIVVYNPNDAQVAAFKKASCKVIKRKEGGGNRFIAKAKSSTGWRIEVYQNHFKGFGQEYTIEYGIKDTNFALYPTSSNSPYYSNFFFPSDDIPPFNGALAFSDDGKDMGIGSIAAFSSNGNPDDAVRFVGHAKCKYPKKHRH